MLDKRKSYEGTHKDKTTKVFAPFTSAETLSSDETNRNSSLKNIQNIPTKFDESPLQQKDKTQNSKY